MHEFEDWYAPSFPTVNMKLSGPFNAIMSFQMLSKILNTVQGFLKGEKMMSSVAVAFDALNASMIG